MITLYLDHQIYSFLLHKDDSTKFQGSDGPQRMETVKKMHDFLNKEKSNFLLFYSHAHLLDLSSDKSGNQDRLKVDLDFRGQWAENNYLIFNEKENSSDYKLVFPKESFEPYWEEQTNNVTDFSNLFDLSGMEGYVDDNKVEELKQQISQLQNLRLPTIDDLVTEEVKQNEDYQKLKEMLNFMNGGNVIDWVNGFTDFTDRFQEEKGFYKKLREVVVSGVEKTKNAAIPLDTPEDSKFIYDLANVDLNSPEKENFVKENLLRLVKKQWADSNKDKEPMIFDLHYQSYLMLDLMGIEKEKATIARNMLHDAQHSFYGGHCEIVVSDDKQFRAKSKLLYKLFGLSTQVLSMEEFMNQSFSLELENIKSSSDLLLTAKHDLSTRLITASRLTAMLNQVKEIKPSINYLHYFNQMLIVEENNGSYLIFRHKVHSYLKQLPYKVIQGITNKTISLFGLDEDGRGLYKWDEENDEINENKWVGRNWNFNGSSLMLQISLQGNHLQLVIG